MNNFSALVSTLVAVTPSIDELDVTLVNDNSGGSFPFVRTAIQGDKNVPVMKLTMNARNPEQMSASPTRDMEPSTHDRGNPKGINKAHDVDAIHLYYDYDKRWSLTWPRTPKSHRAPRSSSSRKRP